MNISITNCNNIAHGTVAISENRLNIKYAINGTGKSTIAKAIEYAANHDENGLKKLTPYAHIGVADDTLLPRVEGLTDDIRIAVFNEE